MEVSFDTAQVFSVGNPHGYHLMPQMVSLRWQAGEQMGRRWWRGARSWTFGLVVAPIFDAPESIYGGGFIGRRYDFLQPGRNWTPFFDVRLGAGFIDSPDEPIPHAQGQDFTFLFVGKAGLRWLAGERTSISSGIMWWHISNAGLSEPRRQNLGLDAVGPFFSLGYTF